MMISRNAHLKMAAGLWGTVGLGLLMAGLFFLFGDRPPTEGASEGAGMTSLVCFAMALVIGFIKGRIVLPRVGKKNVARILALSQRSPLYMTFSVKSWLLVLLMIALGRIIRLGGAPPVVVGTIYVAVGVALLLGSTSYLGVNLPTDKSE
jgi:hypothetical protein